MLHTPLVLVKPLVVRLLAVFAGTVFAVLFAEATLRLFHLAATDSIVTVDETAFARVPGIFEPDQRVVVRRIRQLPFQVRINNLGYRGSDLTMEKPRGEWRVLTLGDSFTFGDFVEDLETLPAQLEAQLPSCRPVRVINAGVGGSTITTQRRMLERGMALDPDVVILVFYENDVADLRDPALWDQLARTRALRSRLPLSVVYPFVRRSALFNLVVTARDRWRVQTRMDEATQLDGDETHALRRAYAQRLEEMHAFLQSRGVPLVFATYPRHSMLSGKHPGEHVAWADQAAEAAGIATVRLRNALLASGLPAERLYLLPLDGHARPRAYTIAAAHLAEALCRIDIVAGRCACG